MLDRLCAADQHVGWHMKRMMPLVGCQWQRRRLKPAWDLVFSCLALTGLHADGAKVVGLSVLLGVVMNVPEAFACVGRASAD